MFLAALLFTLDAGTVLNSPVVAALAVMLIGSVLAWHPLRKWAARLHAEAQAVDRNANSLRATVEEDAATMLDHLDDFLSANGQDVKDLVDPAKRAAAEAHLAEQGKAAVADALKRAL